MSDLVMKCDSVVFISVNFLLLKGLKIKFQSFFFLCDHVITILLGTNRFTKLHLLNIENSSFPVDFFQFDLSQSKFVSAILFAIKYLKRVIKIFLIILVNAKVGKKGDSQIS